MVDLLKFIFDDGMEMMEWLNPCALEFLEHSKMEKSPFYNVVPFAAFDFDLITVAKLSGMNEPSFYRWKDVDELPDPKIVLDVYLRFQSQCDDFFPVYKVDLKKQRRSKL